MSKSGAVFVSWAPENTRSETLARCFGAQIHHLHALGFKRVLVAPLKYVILGSRTLRMLYRERPELIFVLNPPYFSALVVWVYTRIWGGRYILDSHTGAFLESKWTWLEFLHRFITRRAHVCIVTSEELGAIVKRWGGRYFVIGDVPTEFQPQALENLSRPHVTVINTFSYDEPIEAVLEAATLLPDIHFAVTGDLRQCPRHLLEKAPPNLRFTGFTPMQNFVNMLYSSDLAIVLTTENFTMQRGAYESVSLGVPVVTSDWPILRRTFSGGAEFCDNSAEEIARAVRTVLERHEEFKDGVQALRRRRREVWAKLEANFRELHMNTVT